MFVARKPDIKMLHTFFLLIFYWMRHEDINKTTIIILLFINNFLNLFLIFLIKVKIYFVQIHLQEQTVQHASHEGRLHCLHLSFSLSLSLPLQVRPAKSLKNISKLFFNKERPSKSFSNKKCTSTSFFEDENYSKLFPGKDCTSNSS